MRRDRARVGERLLRLSRRLPGGLPADVAAILALSPDVYFDLRHAALPGLGQVLWQDAARATPVAGGTDPIGSALNLGSLGGYAESSGTARPLFGGLFDGIDDRLVWDVTAVPAAATTVFYFSHPVLGFGIPLDSRPSGSQCVFAIQSDNSGRWRCAAGGTAFSLLTGYGSAARSGLRLVWRHGTDAEAWEGGVSLASDADTTAGNRPQGLTLGASRVPSEWFGMSAAAYIRFDRILTAGDLAALPTVIE